MAFFGLTALGPQNTFAAAAKQARYLQIFDDNDFETAWNKINGSGAEHCKVNKIGDIMRCLFKGPIPPTDERHIIDAFENGNFETSETVSYTTYMRMMLDLREQAGNQIHTCMQMHLLTNSLTEHDEIDFHSQPMKATCDFNSSSLFLETLRKCGKRGWIRDKQTTPLTSNQEFGWKVLLDQSLIHRIALTHLLTRNHN